MGAATLATARCARWPWPVSVSIVLLAHHQRDQAETCCCRPCAARGVAGLSGMPRSVLRDGITWLRPWLATSRAHEIDAYVRRHRLKHIEDDSNADARFARNRLRLAKCGRHAESVHSSSAESVAGDVSARGRSRPTQVARGNRAGSILMQSSRRAMALNIASLDGKLCRGAPQQRIALRAWIRRNSHGVGATRQLGDRALLDELPKAAQCALAAGRRRAAQFIASVLRYFRGCCRCCRVRGQGASQHAAQHSTRGPRTRCLAWGGTLRVARVRESGCAAGMVGPTRVCASAQGGEQFQAGARAPAAQPEEAVPGCGVSRPGTVSGPLVYSGGQLVFVPGLGTGCARDRSCRGQPLISVALDCRLSTTV